MRPAIRIQPFRVRRKWAMNMFLIVVKIIWDVRLAIWVEEDCKIYIQSPFWSATSDAMIYMIIGLHWCEGEMTDGFQAIPLNDITDINLDKQGREQMLG